MKKCPLCAEDIQEDAVKCKYCKSDLNKTSGSKPSRLSSPVTGSMLAKWLGIFILAAFAIKTWYLSTPVLAFWYIWKKSKLSTNKKKIIYSGITAIASIVLWVSMAVANESANKTPIFTIIEPSDNSSIQAQSTRIKGRVAPSNSSIMINNRTISPDMDGSFSYEMGLSEEKNVAVLTAKHGNGSASVSLTVNRIFTEEEKAEKEKQKAETEERRKIEEEAKKKEEAERVKQQALALTKMTIKTDDIKNASFYHDKTTPQVSNVNNINLYIVKPSGSSPYLRLRIQYEGDSWLFIQKYIIKADDKTFEVVPGKIERDNYTRVWEWCDEVATDNQLAMVRAIMNSKETKIRSEGTTYFDDRIVTKAEKIALKNVLDAFEALKTDAK